MLKKCPFCGKKEAEAVLWAGGWCVGCTCGIKTPYYARKDGAVRKWNKRHIA